MFEYGDMKGIVYEVAEGGGSGTATVTTPTTPPGSGNVAPAQSSGLTQTDIDKAAAGARREAEKDAPKLVAAQFGFESADAMKAFFEQVKADQEAKKSEHQKAVDKAAALEKERDEAKAKIAQLEAKALEQARDGKILDALRAANAKVPSDALVLMKNGGKIDGLTKDDGSVDEKAVEKAVADFKASRADYFGTGNPGSPSNAGAKPPIPDSSELQKALAEMKRMARL